MLTYQLISDISADLGCFSRKSKDISRFKTNPPKIKISEAKQTIWKSFVAVEYAISPYEIMIAQIRLFSLYETVRNSKGKSKSGQDRGFYANKCPGRLLDHYTGHIYSNTET